MLGALATGILASRYRRLYGLRGCREGETTGRIQRLESPPRRSCPSAYACTHRKGRTGRVDALHSLVEQHRPPLPVLSSPPGLGEAHLTVAVDADLAGPIFVCHCNHGVSPMLSSHPATASARMASYTTADYRAGCPCQHDRQHTLPLPALSLLFFLET